MATGYSKVFSQFWTGETGLKLRAYGRDAQLLALYLVTCPTANQLGLYYLPLPTICHEAGLSKEGASKALQSLSEGGFAHYDETREVVFVPSMARHQFDDRLEPKDNRWKWVVAEIERLKKLPYFNEWYALYRDPFSLPKLEAPSKPLESPSEATSKPNPNPNPNPSSPLKNPALRHPVVV